MKQNQKKLLIGLGVVVVLLLIFGNSMFKIVDAGERGVIFRPFGGGLDTTRVYGEGFHVFAPWNKFTVYNIKERTAEETMDVLDENGLSINVDVTVRYFPTYKKLTFLHQNFGQDFKNQLVVPEVRSTVRQVMGRYTAEEIYSKKRAQVENEIIQEATDKLGDNYITTKAVLIRSINLPPQIKNAIEMKLSQEQESLAYEFKLQKEQKEAERKRIEAEGEARANNIINRSLTPNLLKMRGIETTLKLSQSKNAKIVVIGGDDGLPLILNQ
ncbi:MAG: prohibitin family protein [Bacteroidota bacterium]|nr:prohibitin family protein [Bacteroidota bacterium]